MAHSQTPGLNISVLSTGDTHGHLRSFYYESTKPVGGVAKRAIFFQDKRRHQKMTWLTLDSGDALSGTALSDVFQGYLDIEAMNRLHYDAMTLGVHDFDYGVTVLKQRMAEATFPLLAANVTAADGQPFAQPYVIIERNGAKIAVLGLTTGELAQRVAPENFSGLTVSDPIEIARRLVPELRTKADVVIALTHLGINEDIRLAGQVRGIDLIVGGMSHSQLQVPMKVGETLITHDSAYGATVGLMKMSFAPKIGGGYEKVYFSSQLVLMDGKWVENTNYTAWLDTFTPQIQERMGLIVGTSAITMADTRIHSSETELGNLVCDIMREKAGADVALLPAEFFHAGMPKGPVTLGDLYSMLPYDHYCDVLRVTGGELQQILNDAADQIGKEGFPQVSGVSFGIFNGKAYQVRVNNADIDPFATYNFATSDFLSGGGLGYATLGTITDKRYTGRLIRDMVRDYLTGGAVASSTLYARITFLAQEPVVATLPPPVTQQPAEETVPSEETPPATDTTPAEGSETPAEELAPPAEETAPAETPGAESPVSEQAPAEDHEGLDSLKYDRNGNPLVIEDEVLTDGSSAAEQPAGGEQLPGSEAEPPSTAEEPAAEAAPSADREPMFSGSILGQAQTSAGGLSYVCTLLSTEQGLEFQMEITNNSNTEATLNYATGERFDFLCLSGSDLRWNFNNNKFFVQAEEQETLAPGERLVYRAPWNGVDNGNSPLVSASYTFKAVHQLAVEPVSLTFDAQLSR